MSFRAIPEHIGRYQILSELGRGSMGHVYLALDPNIERRIALKVLLPLLKVGVHEQAELRQRFLVEARAAGKLKHPGVVTLFDADTDVATGLPFIAMEWVDGPSLHDLIQQLGRLPIPRALEITRQVALALDAAHQADLVHRDIKPANILLTAEGEAKVTDFGIAKLASMSMTATGWVPGSPFYMSPEQVRGEAVDGRSDIYSLAVALYQSLTGEVPFHSDSLAGMTYMILEVDPRPPQPLNPGITDELASIIQKALEKRPEDRFENALEFAAALEEVAGRSVWDEPAPVAALSPVAVPPADGAGPTAQPELRVDSGTDPAIPGPRLEPPARKLAPVARYAALGVVLALLFLLGPAVRTSLSEAQPVERVVVAPSPAAMEAVVAADLDPLLALDVEPPPFEEEVALGEDPPVARPHPAAPVVRTAPPRRPPPAPRAAAAVKAPEPVATTPEPADKPAPVVRDEAPAVAVSKPSSPPPGRLEFIFRNRLRNAEVSVWIDEEKVWSAPATAGNLFQRRNVIAILDVEVGPRVIDVRVTGSEGRLDVVRRTEADFVSGETKRLKVSVVLPNKLKLVWAQAGDD